MGNNGKNLTRMAVHSILYSDEPNCHCVSPVRDESLIFFFSSSDRMILLQVFSANVIHFTFDPNTSMRTSVFYVRLRQDI